MMKIKSEMNTKVYIINEIVHALEWKRFQMALLECSLFVQVVCRVALDTWYTARRQTMLRNNSTERGGNHEHGARSISAANKKPEHRKEYWMQREIAVLLAID